MFVSAVCGWFLFSSGVSGFPIVSSRKILSMNSGFSFSSSILFSALSIIAVGSSVEAIALRNSKASLFNW